MIQDQKDVLRELIYTYAFYCTEGIASSDDYDAIELFIEDKIEASARLDGIEIALKVLNQLKDPDSIT